MISLDRLVIGADNALRTLSGAVHAARPSPAEREQGADVLTDPERRLSGALMRVNHVGEVCAQALYQAQALGAASPALHEQMSEASRQENDHLAWTQQRLDELGDRRSLLNPLWYSGAFALGLLAGRFGDRVSRGFVVETERQVERHLAGHMQRLPAGDARSRAIVEQMQVDEGRHADAAESEGAARLPGVVRGAMRAAATLMTFTAHRI